MCIRDRSADAHSGEAAAALGTPAPTALFAAPVPLTDSPDVGKYDHRLIFDGQGRAFAVWLAGVFDQPKSLYSATRRADGSWTEKRLLRDGVWSYDMARDAEGALHLAASHNGISVWGQAGDGWSATSTALPDVTDFSPVWLAAGPGGRVDLFWQKGLWELFHSRLTNGAWSAVTRLSPANATLWAGLYTATTPDGALHVVWHETLQDSLIRYRRLSASGTWGAATTLYKGPVDGLGLAADDAGRLHAVWLGKKNGEPTLDYRWARDGVWQPVETLWRGVLADTRDSASLEAFGVSPAGVAQAMLWIGENSDYVRREPGGRLTVEHLTSDGLNSTTMVFDGVGNPHVAVVDKFGGSTALNVGYAARSETGDWSAPVQVSDDPWYGYGGVPAVDALGRVHFLWLGDQSDPYHEPDLIYTGPLPAATGGASILSRTVSVPAGMADPVLSLMYGARGAVTLDLTGGSAAGPSVRSDPLLLPPAPAGYRHEWIDLSAYSCLLYTSRCV